MNEILIPLKSDAELARGKDLNTTEIYQVTAKDGTDDGDNNDS